MSYILDALKKLEEKDEKGGITALLSWSADGAPELKRRTLWAYPLTAALLVNAVAIFWSVYPRMPGEEFTIVQAPVLHARTPELVAMMAPEPRTGGEEKSRFSYPSKEVSQDKPQDRPQHKPRNGPQNKHQNSLQSDPQNEDTGKSPALMTPGEGRQTPSSSPSKETRTDGTAIKAQTQPRLQSVSPAAGEISSLDQLPLSVRGNLPPLHVSGHAYSPEPASRVVRINEKILQEGETLTPGLKVEEITSEGTVFSYRGYRFRIGLNSN